VFASKGVAYLRGKNLKGASTGLAPDYLQTLDLAGKGLPGTNTQAHNEYL